MASFKSKLLSIYTLPKLSKEKENYHQTKIRDSEWDAFGKYIEENSKLIDVGCGSGYFLKKAKSLKNCNITGIDPEPGNYGVNRSDPEYHQNLNIIKGFAEKIPIPDNSFDTVLSSHVLEHVNDIDLSLKEMKRIGNSECTFIIGMPNTTMALITLFTQLLFESHIRFVNFFGQPFINVSKLNFKQLFFSYSHSFPENKTILHDVIHYRTKRWKKHIEPHFEIMKIIYPSLYPHPSYWQLFKLKRYNKIGSSVYFICKK